MCLSAGLAHSSLQVYQQLDAGCLGLKLQTNILSGPLFLEPQDCNKGTTHSDTLSVFLHLQSWLCVGMFYKTISCVSYMQIHFLMSLIIVSESDSDSDVPTTS
jgi:hypothetical protein